LRHVIARSVEFEAAVTLELQSAVHGKRPVGNLYALPPLPSLSSTDVQHRITDALSRPTTEDDTHPGPADRFRLIEHVSYNGPRSDSSAVWDLFADRHRVMAEMTAAVARQVKEVSFAST